MAKWYVFDLSFFIPDSKGKTKNKFQKNEKTNEKFNKIFKKNLPRASPKKKNSPGRGDGNKQFFYFGPTFCGVLLPMTRVSDLVSSNTFVHDM